VTAQRTGKTKKKYRDKACLRCGTTYKPASPNQRLCDSCRSATQVPGSRAGPSRLQWRRTQESIPCRRCGAVAGRQCVTTSGAVAVGPHRERGVDVGGDLDPVRQRARIRDPLRRARNKRRVLEHYGTACACCGATEDLTIDHINGDGKAHRDELGNPSSSTFYHWLARNGFPEGYQTLCTPCNLSKGNRECCLLHGEGVASRRQYATLSTRHWRVIFAALSESGSPEAAETFVAVSAQVDPIGHDTPSSGKSA